VVVGYGVGLVALYFYGSPSVAGLKSLLHFSFQPEKLFSKYAGEREEK
jgi:hypothetical protein